MKSKDLPVFDTVNKCQSGKRNMRMKKNNKKNPASPDGQLILVCYGRKPLHLCNDHAETKCIMQNAYSQIMFVIILVLVTDRLRVVLYA